MNGPAHIGRQRAHTIVITPGDDDVAALSLTLKTGVTGAKNVGDRQYARGAFVPVGGAYAPSSNPQVAWGGADGSAADALLAEYDPAAGTVHALRTPGQREPRNAPWRVGKDITLWADKTKASKGFVLRGSMMGDAGFDQHVYIAAGSLPGQAGLVLHHDAPGAPAESNIVYEGGGTRPTIWSDALRIGAGVTKLCQDRTAPPDNNSPDWVYLNATKHGGNRFSGFLASRFSGADAFLSFEAGGPLREASALHDFAYTRDKRFLRRAAFSIARHLWTNGNPKYDAPLWIEEVDEPDVQEPNGHPMRVHVQLDRKATHEHPCKPGKLTGMFKLHKKEPIVETPPCKGSRPPSSTIPPTGNSYGVTTLLMSGFGGLPNPRA